jgi:hypothetical protein
MGSTKKELIGDLQRKPQSLVRDRIIARALAGLYHDFESELGTPKMTLVDDLRAAGYADIVEQVKDGAYDEQPSLEDLEKLRQEIGPETFDQTMGQKERGQA